MANMLAENRRQKIVSYVKEKKFVTVKELAAQLDVTGETIRRDFDVLYSRGELSRAHGGAYLGQMRSYDVDVNFRETKEIEAKQKIAQISRRFIKENDVIFLDSSTTALEIAKAIFDLTLTVVTNSLMITNLMVSHPNIKTITIGGMLDRINLCFTGNGSVSEMEGLYSQKCFVSCRSLSFEHGPMDSNEQLAQVRSAAIQNCNEAFLVADHTKFDDMSLRKIASFDQFRAIITDSMPSDRWLSLAKRSKVELLYA